MRIALILAVLQGAAGGGPEGPSPDTTRLRPDSAAMATAYLDDHARDLVWRARGQRGQLDASVFHYTALARHRLSVGIKSLRRDRVLYRREGVSTLEWWRDRPGQITVHGAREAVPVAFAGLRVPEDLGEPDFVPEPGGDRLWVSPTGGGFAWHPLVEGGEALYRYATGDTTAIRLSDGREVRLVELRVTPRERDFRVVTGSFWIEMENHSVVQAVFRPGREFDVQRDLPAIDPDSEGDLEDVPDLLKPVRFDMRYVTVEYGLWDMRWWMPRLMAFEGYVEMGAMRIPITLEVAYSDYTVEADRHGLPELPPLIRHLAGDPHGKPRPFSYGRTVVVPDDTASLLTSELFPSSFFSEGEAVISEREMRELGQRLGALPPPPWEVAQPRVTGPWALGRGLLRYNRVEGLSAAARVDWDLTRLRMDLTARIGAADLRPRGELGVDVPGTHRSWRMGAYHRLNPVDRTLRPLGIGNSLTALLLGRDDGMYYQASGAEVRLSPAGSGADGAYGLRAYGERQRPVHRETDFSLVHLLGGNGFRENLRATPATQLGVQARLGIDRGLDPVGYRWGAVLDLTGETGAYSFLKPGLTLRAGAPLPGKLVGALELSGGTVLSGDAGAAAVPVQSLWFLGGPSTLRGFAGGEISGRDQLRGRAEVANQFPGARAAVFRDVGWAGRFAALSGRDLAASIGVGASFLDGLLRFDLAHTLQPLRRWRVELYLDALL